MEIQSPHDKFFKETFSDLKVSESFIQNYFPRALVEMIDMRTLHPEKDSHIDKSCKSHSLIYYSVYK